jgi:multidrug resistance efflux pump
MANLSSILRHGLIAMALTALCLGCGGPEQAAPVQRPVRAIRIGDGPALMSRTYPGTAEAVDAVEMSFRVGGPLVAFPGNELGKQVSAGDLLAQIDTRDFEVRLRDTQASLAKARSELEAMRKARPEDIEKLKAALDRAVAAAEFAEAEFQRNSRLVESGAVSRSEFELSQASAKLAKAEVASAKESLRIGEEGARPEDIRAKESQIESLQAAVQTAQDELTDTKLLAPFGGSVSAAYVQNFEVVQPKQRVLRLVNSSELEIRVDIPENLISLVPKVTEAFVTIQAFPELEIPARIAEVGTEPSPTTRTYPVKLRFKPPEGVDIRPGMTGTVRGRGDPMAMADAAGQVVPASAVFSRSDQRLVWVYDPASKTVRSREVNVLGTTPYGMRVSGVEANEWVVTAGVHYLEENQPVRLLTDESAPAEAAKP